MQNNSNGNSLSEEELESIGLESVPKEELTIDELQAHIMKQMGTNVEESSQVENVTQEEVAQEEKAEQKTLENATNEATEVKEEVHTDELEKEPQKENIEEVKQETQQEIKQELQEEVKEEIKEEKDETEIKEETTEEKVEKIAPEFSQWEELNCENSVVKKYIFYVSKDFVPLLDDLNADERSAYINDAIQKKIDFEVAQNKIETKRKVTKHLITMIVTILLASPLMILFAHKAIMATFDNYKYSQENFEKLYRQRFEHDRAYMRSIQYNKEQREKLKNKK